MKDEELLRYSRQIMLPELDVAGQQRLIDARVLIVGMGGLGCPAAMYLAAAGVGQLLIADDDRVELTNLQRQIAHSEANIGQAKVDSVAQTLRGLNPEVEVSAIAERLQGARLDEMVSQVDLVVDACDNFTTRFDINRACMTQGNHWFPVLLSAWRVRWPFLTHGSQTAPVISASMAVVAMMPMPAVPPMA